MHSIGASMSVRVGKARTTAEMLYGTHVCDAPMRHLLAWVAFEGLFAIDHSDSCDYHILPLVAN
jgi:hypothetical protein